MGDPKKQKTPAEELIESLMKDVGETSSENSDESLDSEEQSQATETSTEIEGLILSDDKSDAENSFLLSTESTEYSDPKPDDEFYSNPNTFEVPKEGVAEVSSDSSGALNLDVSDGDQNKLFEAMGALQAQSNQENQSNDSSKNDEQHAPSFLADSSHVKADLKSGTDSTKENTALLSEDSSQGGSSSNLDHSSAGADSEKTVAVAGYQVRSESDYEDRVKVSVGQNRGASSGYQSWSSGGSADSSLAQAESLRIAQEKILDLEKENEKLRQQNEELIAASEIIKERSDLLSTQLNEFKNDREGLEESFKSEIVLLKNHLSKKEAELQKSQIKIEELDSRLKFDLKKIRIRERELENRLELVRAEKNAIVKNKDEQILDLRRKMDVLQMEVESYRQKCVELNKSIESSQESFKRTTRALRLAMANLELQDENKPALKKVD